MTWNPRPREFVSRNPKPAYGPGVLSLSQLRYYLRKFWTERQYGVCHIRGGKSAFLRWCGDEAMQAQISTKLIDPNPRSEYLPARIQRVVSRKVLAVLRGEMIFIEDERGRATWRPLLGAPEPPVPGEVLPPDHQFRIEHTVLGPRIRRF